MKKFFVLLILFSFLSKELIFNQVKEPKSPIDPDKKTVSRGKYNLNYKKNNGFFYKGYVEGFSNFYIDSLKWEGNIDGNKKLFIESVKSILIKGYTVRKKTFDNLSIVYYVPSVFDIELVNGQIIKGAKGYIKEIDQFDVYDELGKEKCYTYFVRYWLEDKKMFSDNKSTNYNETPPIPDEVVTFIEFVR